MLSNIIKGIMNAVNNLPKVASKPSFYEYVKSKYESKNISWDEINIFGIRNATNQDKDIYNDYICIADSNTRTVSIFQGTTDPGKYWTEAGGYSEDKNGVAHLCLGYCKNSYQVGIHGGKKKWAHEAMIQTGNTVKIWRDKNKNYIYDEDDDVISGYFGINIHSVADDNETIIGSWSAGCQVIKKRSDMTKFMDIVKSSTKYKTSNKACFSYYLFTIEEIDMSYIG